jgi:hypothetical protein
LPFGDARAGRGCENRRERPARGHGFTPRQLG